MARYYRYRRGYRRPRRYPRRYYRRSNTRRFINGSSRSQCRVKVPISVAFEQPNVGLSGAVYSKAFSPFVTSANPFSAVTSPLYKQYCNLYDEVKCIGGKVVISIGTPVGGSAVPSLTVVTAWDRRLTKDDATSPPSFDDLMNYSTQQKAVAVNNSIAKLKRSCYASDLLEKAQWHDCTLTTVSSFTTDEAYQSTSNVNFFAPGMWLGASQSGSSSATISYQADIVWYFAFRNPKYGGSVAPSRGNVIVSPMDFGGLDGDDGDMDIDVPDSDGIRIFDEHTQLSVASAAADDGAASPAVGGSRQTESLTGALRRSIRSSAPGGVSRAPPRQKSRSSVQDLN